jgi:hypothetical protein
LERVVKKSAQNSGEPHPVNRSDGKFFRRPLELPATTARGDPRTGYRNQVPATPPVWPQAPLSADGAATNAAIGAAIAGTARVRAVSRPMPAVSAIRPCKKEMEDLATDPMRTRDRCDWAAKRFLLETFREAEKLDWNHAWLQALDLEYHDVSLDNGLYYELVREGQVQRIVTEEQIRRAIFYPPDGTRAFYRAGRLIHLMECIDSHRALPLHAEFADRLPQIHRHLLRHERL